MVGVLAWLLLGFFVGTGVGYCAGCALDRVGQAASAEPLAPNASSSESITLKPACRIVRLGDQPRRRIFSDDE